MGAEGFKYSESQFSARLTHLSPQVRLTKSSASPQPSWAVRLWSSHRPFWRSFTSRSFCTGTGMRGKSVPYHSSFKRKLLTICPIVMVHPPPALGSISCKWYKTNTIPFSTILHAYSQNIQILYSQTSIKGLPSSKAQVATLYTLTVSNRVFSTMTCLQICLLGL